MRVLTVFLLLTGALGVTPGFAQQAQSSEDIIKFFGQAADLGASAASASARRCRSKNAAATSAAQAELDMLINFDLNSAD